LKLHHELAKNIKGTFGASFTNQLNSSLAEEKLIPGYGANSFGVFAFEQIDLKKFTISVGGRFDTKKLHVDRTVFEKDSLGNPTKLVNEQNLTFNALTGSVGAVYKFTEGLSAYSNIGRGWRAPSEYELFVDGIHEGTGRYDKGLRTLNSNSEPKPELSLNVDVGIRFSNNKIRFETAAYRNEIDNFIYPAPTGAFYVVTDLNTGDTTLRLPIYDINQAKSVFYGYEYNLDFQPLKWFVLNATGDYVISKNFLTENPRPFTPASKNILGFKVQKSKLSKLLNPYAGLELKFVSAQNMVDPLEAKTDRYTLLNASAGFEFPFAKSIASVDFSVDNLLNTKYVDHMSRYRYYALNPGRSFNLHLSAPFSF
jgi:iron complex outermembrane receptor protein